MVTAATPAADEITVKSGSPVVVTDEGLAVAAPSSRRVTANAAHAKGADAGAWPVRPSSQDVSSAAKPLTDSLAATTAAGALAIIGAEEPRMGIETTAACAGKLTVCGYVVGSDLTTAWADTDGAGCTAPDHWGLAAAVAAGSVMSGTAVFDLSRLTDGAPPDDLACPRPRTVDDPGTETSGTGAVVARV